MGLNFNHLILRCNSMRLPFEHAVTSESINACNERLPEQHSFCSNPSNDEAICNLEDFFFKSKHTCRIHYEGIVGSFNLFLPNPLSRAIENFHSMVCIGGMISHTLHVNERK